MMQTFQVEQSIGDRLGKDAVVQYQAWLEERELWVTKERQAADRLELAQCELARVRNTLGAGSG